MLPLQQTLLPEKGQYVGFSTTIKDAKFMVCVWSDCNRRYFIALAGSMEQDKPQEQVCWRKVGSNKDNVRRDERVHIKLPMPQASKIYLIHLTSTTGSGNRLALTSASAPTTGQRVSTSASF